MIFGAPLVFVGVFVFSFFLWRRLREDYTADQIFVLTLLLLVGIWLGLIIGRRFLPDYSFWTLLFGFFLMGFYGVKKLQMRIFEVIDSALPAFLWAMFFFQPLDLWQKHLPPYIESLLPAVAIGSYYYFSKNYRKFYWYPSGKIGFAGLASFAFYFLLKSLIAFYLGLMLSFGKIEVVNGVLSILVSGICVMILYIRSDREDFSIFFKKIRRKP